MYGNFRKWIRICIVCTERFNGISVILRKASVNVRNALTEFP